MLLEFNKAFRGGGGEGHKFGCKAFGIWTQWPHLRLDSRRVRHLGEGTMPEGTAGRALFLRGIHLKLRKKHVKPLVKVAETCLLDMIRYVDVVTLYRYP